MSKNLVYGKIETEYESLVSGGEIDIEYFVTTNEALKKAGFENANEFLDYVDTASKSTVVAIDMENNKQITAYQFNRMDGYSVGLKVGSARYHYAY